MPITPVGLAAALIPSLVSCGNIGIAVPQFSLGVATGVSIFCQSSTVVTVDVGTLGVGAGLFPFLVPQPLILSSMLAAFAATGTVGVMMPPLALGLSIGLNIGFLQGLLTTVHPGVGLGSGVAKVIPSSAVPSMIAGFAAAGMVGPAAIKMATAIGIGLTIIFAAYITPIVIVGPPSILPGAGPGFGKIV